MISPYPVAGNDFVPGVVSPSARDDDMMFVFRGADIHGANETVWRPAMRKDVVLAEIESEHYLGNYQVQACFAVSVGPDATGDFGNLRGVFAASDSIMFAIAGRAVQVLDWWRSHQFCGRCGQPARTHDRDRALVCDDCSLASYPRISPSIIVLVHDEDRILLARNQRFPTGMFSTLAGFVEPGESIEQTVHREVHEEVGVEVDQLQYLGSQPWPFPNSLMLGFHAHYAGGDIRLQEEEIAEARWFNIDGLPQIPGKLAISRWLIDTFLTRRGIAIDS